MAESQSIDDMRALENLLQEARAVAAKVGDSVDLSDLERLESRLCQLSKQVSQLALPSSFETFCCSLIDHAHANPSTSISILQCEKIKQQQKDKLEEETLEKVTKDKKLFSEHIHGVESWLNTVSPLLNRTPDEGNYRKTVVDCTEAGMNNVLVQLKKLITEEQAVGDKIIELGRLMK